RTADLPLDAASRAQLLVEARNLGATQAPAGLAEELAGQIDFAVRLAFIDGFRQLMWISCVIALIGLAVWLAIVWREPQAAAEQPTVLPVTQTAE
ncbi:MAG: hypothetical protein ACT4QE_03995, partial [Anaerolineales bacterium]